MKNIEGETLERQSTKDTNIEIMESPKPRGVVLEPESDRELCDGEDSESPLASV